jgi:glutathione S-transferase
LPRYRRRNKIAGLKGRAIVGPHDYEQIPALATDD